MESNNKPKHLMLFFIILTIGLALRILWVAAVDTYPFSDFLLYHKGALSILEGKGFRIYGYTSAYEPIGYPAFLAGLYFLFTPSILVPKIANILLSCIIMLLVYAIARFAISRSTGLIAMLLIAVSPRNIVYTSVLSTEIIFTALFLLLNFLIVKRRRDTVHSILIGVLTGMLALIKPYMLIFQFVVFAVDLFELKNLAASLKRLCLITAAMAVVISPWTIRNYMVFHRIIPVSTNGGYNLFVNNNPYANGGWQDPFKLPDSPLLKYLHEGDEFWDEVSVDAVGKKLAIDWISSNPGKFIILGFEKIRRTFLECDDAYWATNLLSDGTQYKYSGMVYSITRIGHTFSLVIAIAYLSLIIFGLAINRKVSRFDIIILINVLFFLCTVFAFEGQPRYSFPVLPLVAIMGASFIHYLSAPVKSLFDGRLKPDFGL